MKQPSKWISSFQKERAFDRLQLERRIASIITTEPERTVYVTSPEDIILSKLEWYRMGDEVSDRQWRDILGVVKTKSSQLDLAYLRYGAGELGVEDLLDRARTRGIGSRPGR